MYKNLRRNFTLGILSLVLVFLSIGLGTNANSSFELSNLGFGLPIPFLFSDQSQMHAGYEGGYPHRFGLGLDFLDRDFTINFVYTNLLLSVLIVWSLLILLWYYGSKGFRDKVDQ